MPISVLFICPFYFYFVFFISLLPTCTFFVFRSSLLLLLHSFRFIVSFYLYLYFVYFHYSFLLLLLSASQFHFAPPVSCAIFFTFVSGKSGVHVPAFHLSNLHVLRFLQPNFYFFLENSQYDSISNKYISFI